MKINEIISEETFQPPSIDTGDKILVGKFKNRKAEVTGFKTDKNHHPILRTTKGDQQLFKPRISKLMDVEEDLSSEFVNSKVNKREWRKVGQGDTASVWSHINDPVTVVKLVGGGEQRIVQSDQKLTSVAFVHFCVDHGHESKHLPQIYGINTEDPEVVQIRIERLSEIHYEVGKALGRFSHIIKNSPTSEWNQHRDNLDTIFVKNRMSKQNKADDLIRLINFLQKNASIYGQAHGVRGKIIVDLHEENWMKRADGTVVAVDPWYKSGFK